ncbi:NB-ARC domain containing protein [Nitzschia inconspicua]|uniref:NB-ARC domain containing protein n=1 Tax=Nitzschia inconspicua TaxID=303405 RepID=A0A9K3L380_9STRA|nr:NB-ARC domain containing protein [Nitzschia inconspicua]
MGVRHTTLASLNATTSSTGDDFSKDILEADPQLASVYQVDRYLFPGSGRMMRTFRLKHKQNGSSVVVKLMWLTPEELKQEEDGEETTTTANTSDGNSCEALEQKLQQQQRDLRKIHQSLHGEPHMAPFSYWFVGPYRLYAMNSVRPAILLRPHFYSTLSDRLASRPFLTHVEKLWIVHQLLEALDHIHSKGIVHGFLTTENIGLSSWNWVVLMDFASYKPRTALPDDDPSEYLYYFQELFNQQGSDSTPREKRCYLAPERFYTPGQQQQQNESEADKDGDATRKCQPPLTSAMDIFSAGCIIMETFLNGERALDLGDLMEYRKQQTSQTLQQKLNKIEFSALRAACRHMLSLDPSQRLSTKAYLDRLKAADLIPESFETLSQLMNDVTTSQNGQSVVTPDARLAKAAACYTTIIYETIGIYDAEGGKYFQMALGANSAARLTTQKSHGDNDWCEHHAEKCSNREEKKEWDTDDLLVETEALLKQLETLRFDEEEILKAASKEAAKVDENEPAEPPARTKGRRSQMSQSSLLVYLQLILSTVRHVQRPASKLVALQLMQLVGKHCTDEARLQRIVPVAVSLLQDHDPLVRASSVKVLTSTISIVDSFPPSDSKVFPQYIFKRVAHLATDPSLVVRLCFAKCIGTLAETSHRFLDISHAVRLYEAVGGSGGSQVNVSEKEKEGSSANVFDDDVANLLHPAEGSSHNSKSLNSIDSSISDIVGAGKTLISSTYNSELGALHETISRWVVHITTDVSEHSSPAKRTLLVDMARLCTFFGLDGVMAFILPQVLSFLNDRKDWLLRATLFKSLTSVCRFIGRAATEHFVLPILETGLADTHEVVTSRALQCLSELLQNGLLSRASLLGRIGINGTEESTGLLAKYRPLLLHPSFDIRIHAIATVNALCELVGELDAEVFVVPIIKPFVRFHPSSHVLSSPDELEKCLSPAWTRERFESELRQLTLATDSSPTSGQWTSIALQIREGENDELAPEIPGSGDKPDSSQRASFQKDDICNERDHLVRSYLQSVARSRNYSMKMGASDVSTQGQLNHAIEGSLKLAQQIKFPRQDIPGPPFATLPTWYVYGLSIMDQAGMPEASDGMTPEEAARLLCTDESRSIEAAGHGEWGSETCLNPTLTDTSLLLTKLGALQVPPLPLRLSEKLSIPKPATPQRPNPRESGDPREPQIFKPKIDTVIATSRRAPGIGHTAPVTRLAVSHDQRFFVSGSHDGTCRVWEAEKAERSNGTLESSLTYIVDSKAEDRRPPRVNDLVMIEGSHSVACGSSDGSVQVWRVDLVSSSSNMESKGHMRRVAGSSSIRMMNHFEGEILAVNQYNTPGASILMFATQKGRVHSWDLRSAKEPFCLENFQDTGYITSMAVSGDRHWAVIGTNRGVIALWDLRFQQVMKLWQHSRFSSIDRLATSFVPPPQSWVGKGFNQSDSRPYIFAASGHNECAMFDALNGHCSECFRTVEYGSRSPSTRVDGVPMLSQIPLLSSDRQKSLFSDRSTKIGDVVASSFRSVKSMVGSTGASDYSFLITSGSDCRIRFWDFSMPSRCYVSSGIDPVQPRPSFERIDFDDRTRLMLCRQAPASTVHELDSSRVPRKLFQGTRAIPQGHHECITDLKFLKTNLVSCSRDCTVKIWR